MQIAYRDIQRYRDPNGLCEKGCCAKSYGKVNTCAPGGGLRLHALGSLRCDQKELIIELKEAQSLCGKHYKNVVIAMAAADHSAFMKMLNGKFGIHSSSRGVML